MFAFSLIETKDRAKMSFAAVSKLKLKLGRDDCFLKRAAFNRHSERRNRRERNVSKIVCPVPL